MPVAARRRDALSLAEARRIALAAQGFAAGRPVAAAKRQLAAMVDALGVVQIDSVNVLARAHVLPGFARLGAYPVEALHELAYAGRKRRLFEYWGHEASYLPLDLQPLMRWRMARAARGEDIYTGLARFGRDHRPTIDAVRREIEVAGPRAAGELEPRGRAGEGGWWGWSDTKRAVEWLFWAGEVTTATRRGAFERVYDLTERVLPRAVLDVPTPAEPDAIRALIARAARAVGIGSERCIRDYYRIGPADAKRAIAELVEAGDLRSVAVKGWDKPVYLHREAHAPRRVEAHALLAPFDPLIWQRERVEALFGARVRLEIYTPAEKREHGYYVLPFLMGEAIRARVDLKSDRAARALVVQAAHLEAGFEAGPVAEALAAELVLMARWLGLDRVVVRPKGDLAAALAVAV